MHLKEADSCNIVTPHCVHSRRSDAIHENWGCLTAISNVEWAGQQDHANELQKRTNIFPLTIKHYPFSLVPRIGLGNDPHRVVTGIKGLIHPKHTSADVCAVLFRYIKGSWEIIKHKMLF